VTHPPDIALFFGRLHVLLVHLPIGVILLLALLEGLARFPRFKHADANMGIILAFAVPVAVFSAVCGWLLSLAGGYQARLLQLHKWTGIGTAAILLLAGIFYWLDLKKPYRWSLFASFLVLIVASHFGGSLTHGSDYLVRYAPGPLRAWLNPPPKTQPATVPAKPKDANDAVAFAGVVQPILQQNCLSCHGPQKAKAGLRLDSLAGILKGGDNGPAIVAGKGPESELIRRIRLPSTEEDHMPPEGKPQPSRDDIALLQWWIDAGALADKKVGQLKPPATVARILAARFGAPTGVAAREVAPKPINDVLPVASDLAQDLNVPITALSPKEPWLQCNASVAGTNFGDAELVKLNPIGANLRWLDLAGTSVTDTGLVALASMPNLIRLHLERTSITDAGLSNLTDLAKLEYLDIYGTPVTDAGLDTLQTLPRLKQLFLWQTKVTPEAGKAFVQARTDQDQLDRWQQEIEQLQAKIRDAHINVDLGTLTNSAATVASTNSTPINTECPVSGKPIDPTKTVVHEGTVIAFCCDDCKAKFLKDPQPILAKLNLTKESKEQTGK
jgi:mono/diheme cytochrome c family protein